MYYAFRNLWRRHFWWSPKRKLSRRVVRQIDSRVEQGEDNGRNLAPVLRGEGTRAHSPAEVGLAAVCGGGGVEDLEITEIGYRVAEVVSETRHGEDNRGWRKKDDGMLLWKPRRCCGEGT